MLSERTRNVTVGLTLMISLAVLMYGIVLLGKFPEFGALRPYSVMLIASNANGITTGSQVQLNGVYAGQVTAVSLATDATGKVVAHVVLQIEHDKRIPESAKAILKQPQAVGNPIVAIDISDLNGPLLPQDGSAIINAESADTGLIPKDVLDGVRKVATDLHDMLVYAPPELIEKQNPNDPNRVKENISTVVVRLNRTVKGIQDLLTDPAVHANVREMVKNFDDSSAQLKTILAKADGVVTKVDGAMAKVDGVVVKIDGAVTNADTTVKQVGAAATQASATLDATQREIVRVSQKLVETLAQVEKSTKDLTEGKGTTGRLVSDPRLYDGLLDLSRSLKSTVDDLDFLMKKWKDEGVNLRLGK